MKLLAFSALGLIWKSMSVADGSPIKLEIDIAWEGSELQYQAMEDLSWMESMDDSTYLSQMSIPGTHDSAASSKDSLLCEDYTFCKTQEKTIYEQLNGGVRFLDIRLKHIHDTFQIYHGPLTLDLSFDEVLIMVTTFLKAYPSEAVIMSYQGEGNAVHCTRTFHETLDWYLNKADYSDYFYTDNKVPKMGDVRGKIVLLNFRGYGRSDGTQGMGSPETFNSSTVANTWTPRCNPFFGGDPACQDYYDSLRANLNKANIHSNSAEKLLYITYTSATNFDIFAEPSDYARIVNKNIREYLDEQSEGAFGVFVMDFIFKFEMQPSVIYRKNFKPSERNVF